MKYFFTHLRTYILRGLLAIIPIVLSALAIQFLYVVIDKRFVGLFNRWLGFSIPGLGILLVVVILYFIGLITSNVIGKQIFNLIERITQRIPIIKTTYQLGRQLSESFSLSEKQAFQRVVLLEAHQKGVWTIGFVTGTILDKRDGSSEELLKVFVPTVPNPTSGFVFIVRSSQTIDPKMTVEEGIKIILSAGIIGPKEIN